MLRYELGTSLGVAFTTLEGDNPMAETYVETGATQVVKVIVLRHIVKLPKIKFGRTPRKWRK